MSALVSILIPTYNRAGYIGQCLDSLLAQTQPACEIIVIDDGSEDGTAELVQGYGEAVTYVRKDNGGKPSAVNLGLARARGDWIWIFDDDDVALPDAIETRLKALAASPSAAFVYAPHYLAYNGPDGSLVRGALNAVPKVDHAHFFSELCLGCFFHLGSTLVSAHAYREIGRFDESLLSSEDYDLQLRLARRFEPVFSPSPVFLFRQHPGLRGAKQIRYAGQDRSTIFRRYDHKVGLKLRQDTALEDFSPRGERNGGHRRALLHRAMVMASKACLDEMFQDIAAALAATAGPLSADELALITRAMLSGYADDACRAEPQSFLTHCRRLASVPGGRQATRALALGLFRLAKGYPGTLSAKCQRLLLAARVAACLSDRTTPMTLA